MPDIEKAAFGGRDPITGAEWSTLSTPSMGQQAVEEFLEAQGWDQRAAGVVGLKLSPDNSKIMAARLALVGNWQDEPMHMQAKKLWTDAPENLSLEVTLNNLAAFRFADGDMWSGFVAGDSVRHKFVETTADGPKEPTDEELATWGVQLEGSMQPGKNQQRQVGHLAVNNGADLPRQRGRADQNAA